MIRRSPRQLGWRSSNSLAHPVKATSQDSRGCTHSPSQLLGTGTTVRFHLQRTTDPRANLPMSERAPGVSQAGQCQYKSVTG